jgi:tetratricopeptide (TPR) repeat protein
MAGVTTTAWGHEKFLKANEAYNQKDYADAVALYEEVIKEGYADAILYYNLGNACFKDNQLAKSLLWYERALRLDPSNEDIQHNIAFANQQTTDNISVPPEFFLRTVVNTLCHLFSVDVWAVCSIFLLVIICLCVALMLVFSRWRIGLFFTTCILFLLMVLSITFAALQMKQIHRKDEAIVMRKILTVKSTPDTSGTDLFTVHEGIKVWITDKAGKWIEVRFANGDKGWITKDAIEVI